MATTTTRPSFRIEWMHGDHHLVAIEPTDEEVIANSAALAELMIGTSDEIVKMHKSRQALITDHLSSLVLEATGPLMFGEASQPNGPVLWLNHDVIARQLIALHG